MTHPTPTDLPPREWKPRDNRDPGDSTLFWELEDVDPNAETADLPAINERSAA